MKIIYTKSYERSVKKLKNRKKELELLDEITNYIYSVDSFNTVLNDPHASIYGFERLKHELNEFYSFRLSKTIRLIGKPKDSYIELYLVYVSIKHYEDFDIEKVIYDD